MGKEIIKEITKEATKEIAKDVYNDAAKPIIKPSGELLGLVPRTIKAALSGLEMWILTKEYNVEETRKLLEEKLKDTSPEQIQPPEAYIAVPALQYISYCMDNQVLRNMYANLLANSMTAVVKNGVHPGFIEVIKQLSPDEAKILNYFSFNKIIPTISFRLKNSKGEHIAIQNNFSDIGELYSLIQVFEGPLIRLILQVRWWQGPITAFSAKRRPLFPTQKRPIPLFTFTRIRKAMQRSPKSFQAKRTHRGLQKTSSAAGRKRSLPS
jgi:hypothetical protein